MIKQSGNPLLLEILLEDKTIFSLSLYILPISSKVQNVTSIKNYSNLSDYFQIAQHFLIFIFCSLRQWTDNKFIIIIIIITANPN